MLVRYNVIQLDTRIQKKEKLRAASRSMEQRATVPSWVPPKALMAVLLNSSDDNQRAANNVSAYCCRPKNKHDTNDMIL